MVKISFETNDTPALSAKVSVGLGVNLSDAAAARIDTILKNKPKGTHLRISVKGGGCNGFSYDFQLVTDKQKTDTDLVNPNFGHITVWIPETSLIMMKGSTIDYEETLSASQFIVKNPNATSECGCGNSFGV